MKNDNLGPNVGLSLPLGSSLLLKTDQLQQKIFGREGGTADIQLGSDQLISERYGKVDHIFPIVMKTKN